MKIVTIVIPSLHRPDLTSRCLEFLQQQTMPRDAWEVVVIENEARAENVLRHPLPPNTRRIDLVANEGTTGSINRGVVASQSRYLLLLNNDIELQPDYLEILVAALERDAKLGFVVGKLLRATQRTHLDGAGDAMLMGGAAFRLGHCDENRGQYDEPMPILSGCGAAVLYRREVFEAAGWLDQEFFAYLDDLDLSLRAQLIGFSGVYVPQAVAFHIGSATFGQSMHPRVIEYLTRNQLYLLIKDYPERVFVRMLPRIAVYQLLWFAYAISNRGLVSCIRGLRAAIRGRGIMRRKHAELMAKRKLSDDEFVRLLQSSEQQIYEWQHSLSKKQRSSLLHIYFAIFGRPQIRKAR